MYFYICLAVMHSPFLYGTTHQIGDAGRHIKKLWWLNFDSLHSLGRHFIYHASILHKSIASLLRHMYKEREYSLSVSPFRHLLGNYSRLLCSDY